MSGSFYLIAKIVLFMLAAAVIGYFIGRITARRGPAEPLKRLGDVEGVPARAPSPSENATQAAELRRRLGVAYQTIRELEEKNIKLESAAAEPEVQAAAEPVAGVDDAIDDSGAEGSTPEAEADGDAEVTADADAEAEGSTGAAAAAAGAAAAMGPADRIRAAKEARDRDRSDLEAELAAKEDEIQRLKGDLEAHMAQAQDLADTVPDTEA